ncbi:MAG: Fic family protein [Phocaeicola sp.]
MCIIYAAKVYHFILSAKYYCVFFTQINEHSYPRRAVKQLIDTYYKEQPIKNETERTEEADKVSARIAEILSERSFSFSPNEYLSIHRRLFTGMHKFAGKIRDYNITKSEWVLNGETVLYASASTLKETLEYDFKQEKSFSYKGLSIPEVIEHIAHFISDLWQIHVFGEGNTRTTALFLIKYLRKLGLSNLNNDMFAQHSWYFRNSLVRANYQNIAHNIHSTHSYLIRFLSNILLNKNHVLKNREMHVQYIQNETSTENVGVNVGVKKEIIDNIRTNPSLTTKQLAEITQKSSRTIERHMKELREAGIIARIGSDKSGDWLVNDSTHF